MGEFDVSHAGFSCKAALWPVMAAVGFRGSVRPALRRWRVDHSLIRMRPDYHMNGCLQDTKSSLARWLDHNLLFGISTNCEGGNNIRN
jgi:hypothetical protein